MTFRNQVAVVTGAAQGIGAAVAGLLARRGARLVALDVQEERLRSVVTALEAEGLTVTSRCVDVRDRDAIERAITGVEREIGPIDLLANVAGVLRVGPILELTDEDWATTLAVNTSGVIHVSRAVARHMVPRRRGAIVTVTSNAASTPRWHMAAYAASKAATTMFTQCLGLELAPHGIRCNVVSPGSTDTPMQRALWTDSGPRAVLDGAPSAYRVGIPLRRIAAPEDVAETVAFLLSDAARHVTMHDLRVDGGATLGR